MVKYIKHEMTEEEEEEEKKTTTTALIQCFQTECAACVWFIATHTRRNYVTQLNLLYHRHSHMRRNNRSHNEQN